MAVTVDTIVGGNREKEIYYTGFTIPMKLKLNSVNKFYAIASKVGS